jgi:hypothetical protein
MEHLHSIEKKYTKRGVVCQRNGRAERENESTTVVDAKSAKKKEEIEPQRRQDAMGKMEELR